MPALLHFVHALYPGLRYDAAHAMPALLLRKTLPENTLVAALEKFPNALGITCTTSDITSKVIAARFRCDVDQGGKFAAMPFTLDFGMEFDKSAFAAIELGLRTQTPSVAGTAGAWAAYDPPHAGPQPLLPRLRGHLV